MMPRTTLFHSNLGTANPSTNGEMSSQMPRITLLQLQPDCRGVLVRMRARMATAAPVATLFHIAAESSADPSTNGAAITHIPKRALTQTVPLVSYTCTL